MEHLLCEPTAGGECNVCGMGILSKIFFLSADSRKILIVKIFTFKRNLKAGVFTFFLITNLLLSLNILIVIFSLPFEHHLLKI